MSRLFIAGDSFASFAKDQPIGNSWSEILASKLGLDLYNLARPGASNFSIALQVDWITDHFSEGDYVIIYLTDCYRKLLVDLNVERDTNKHILETQNLHRLQRSGNVLTHSENPRLINGTFITEGREKEYFKNWFDPELQFIEDRLLITGSISKLSKLTNRFFVCRGGFGTKSPYFGKKIQYQKVNDNIDHTTFCIEPEQYVSYTSEYLITFSEKTSYINHLDDMAHRKVAILFNKMIN